VRELWVLFGVAIESIGRNKMRSALTALGIIIGVACVIAMIAVGQGSRAFIQAQISSPGANFLRSSSAWRRNRVPAFFTGQSMLTEDGVAVAAECLSVASVSPYSRTAAQVVRGDLNWGTGIQGVGVQWPSKRSWAVGRGDVLR
jgi:putative ABC transport system permease protein